MMELPRTLTPNFKWQKCFKQWQSRPFKGTAQSNSANNKCLVMSELGAVEIKITGTHPV